MTTAARSALDALRQYCDLPAHDASVWRRCLGPEAIACHAAADAAEVDGLILAAREVPGAPRTMIGELHRAVRDARREADRVVGMDGRPYEGQPTSTLAEALRDAGCDDAPELSIPDGYELGPEGQIYQLVRTRDGVDTRLVAPGMICVTSRSVSREGRTWLGIGWRGAWGRWVRRVVPRTVLTRRDEMAGLARDGAPVDSSTITPVQRWLAAVESVGGLPTRPACETMGWVDPSDPSRGFVIGADVVTGDASVDPAEMVGTTDELSAVVEGYALGGTWEGWRNEVWGRVAEHPIACAMSLVALCGPLLDLVPEARPMMGDLGSRTSQGKSILMASIASIWGHPDRTVGKWSSTARGLEARGRWHGGVPLVMDDTKEADSPDGREKIIGMMHAYGDSGGRARMGPTGGLEVSSAIRGVMITAGETPIAVMAGSSQGAITRLLTVRRPPWGVGGAEGARMVEALRVSASTHYGHAGRRYVSFLASRTPHQIGRIRAHYLSELARLRSDMADAEGPAQRMVAHVALLATAAVVAHRAWDVPPPMDAVEAAAEAVREAGALVEIETRAHEAMWQYAQAHRTRMQGQNADLPASASLIGRWRSTDARPYLLRSEALAVLERQICSRGERGEDLLARVAERGLVALVRQRLHHGSGAGNRPIPMVELLPGVGED